MSVALIPLWMLSGAMFPAGGSHGWVRWLMRVDPMTYAVSAVRRGLTGGAVPAGGGSAALELGVTALFALLAVILAVAVCKRRT